MICFVYKGLLNINKKRDHRLHNSVSTYYDWPQLVIISFVIKQTFKNVHVYVFVYHLNIDYNLHQVALDFKQI